jgi:O-antigen ligase
VHLAGAGSFRLLGLAPTSPVSLLLLALGVALTAIRTRGGLLAFALSLGLIAAVRPRVRRLWIGGLGASLALALLLQANVGFSVMGRDFSARQLLANVTSIFGSVESSHLDGPRSWRLEWWSEIVDYTVFGPYFWTGKGFGINLARDDGFHLGLERALRSPHNGHLTILARAGVPGFLLWLLVQASWLRAMSRAYRASRSAGRERWARLFLFLTAYWLAFLVNSTFDVYLEGPMGGVWFWTVFGCGLAAVHIYEHRPLVLEQPARSAVGAGRRDSLRDGADRQGGNST